MSNKYNTAPCGTMSGYSFHLKYNEPTCAPCRKANAEDAKRRRKLKEWDSPKAKLERYLRGDLG